MSRSTFFWQWFAVRSVVLVSLKWCITIGWGFHCRYSLPSNLCIIGSGVPGLPWCMYMSFQEVLSSSCLSVSVHRTQLVPMRTPPSLFPLPHVHCLLQTVLNGSSQCLTAAVCSSVVVVCEEDWRVGGGWGKSLGLYNGKQSLHIPQVCKPRHIVVVSVITVIRSCVAVHVYPAMTGLHVNTLLCILPQQEISYSYQPPTCVQEYFRWVWTNKGSTSVCVCIFYAT